MRTATTLLPLHSGKAPRWLFRRMVDLGGLIAEAIVENYGTQEFLKRLSDGYWFQAFGCILGFDWHSSGLTTTTLGALKQSLNKKNLGIKILGGKGKTSLKTPEEIEKIEFNFSDFRKDKLKQISRLIAKIDNNILQDGYELYHHCFILDEMGRWVVIQQGLSNQNNYARRYHWLYEKIIDRERFFKNPWKVINSLKINKYALNLASEKSKDCRKIILDLSKERPNHIINLLYKLTNRLTKQSTLLDFRKNIKNFEGNPDNTLFLTPDHKLTVTKLNKKSINEIRKILTISYESQPDDFKQLVLTKGMGRKTLLALTLVSELVYGKQADWQDPAKFSYAHGGKDGWPYPVNKKRYDQTINLLREDIALAKIERDQAKRMLRKIYHLFNKN